MAVAVGVGVGVAVGFGVGAAVGSGWTAPCGVTVAIGSTVLVVGAGGPSFSATFGTFTRTLLESAPARLRSSSARTVYRYVLPGLTFVSVYEVRAVFPRLFPSRRIR